MSPTSTLYSFDFEPMPLYLAIREEFRDHALAEETPKSHEQQTSDSAVPESDLKFIIDRKARLSGARCVYLISSGSEATNVAGGQEFATQLAEVMDSDRSGQLPATVLWQDNEEKRTRRDNAERRIRECHSFGHMVSCLNDDEWVLELSGDGRKLSDQDFLPIDFARAFAPSRELYMAGLAREIERIAKKGAEIQEADVRNELEEYCCLALDLGKAATQCSDMKTYVCISFYLFWVAVKVWEEYKQGNQPRYIAERYGNKLRNIAVIYLRNYVAWVLLGESALQVSMGKENTEASK